MVVGIGFERHSFIDRLNLKLVLFVVTFCFFVDLLIVKAFQRTDYKIILIQAYIARFYSDPLFIQDYKVSIGILSL